VNSHGSPFGRTVRQVFQRLERRRLYGEQPQKARGAREIGERITPFLMFEGRAEDAIDFYVSVFPGFAN
jgi:hypothetical protein